MFSFSSKEATPYYYNDSGGSVTGNSYWWTMSPFTFYGDAGSAYVFNIGGSSASGYLGHPNGVAGNAVIRPVLSLKSCVKWKSGDGTSDNPYTVDTLSAACSTAEN